MKIKLNSRCKMFVNTVRDRYRHYEAQQKVTFAEISNSCRDLEGKFFERIVQDHFLSVNSFPRSSSSQSAPGNEYGKQEMLCPEIISSRLKLSVVAKQETS